MQPLRRMLDQTVLHQIEMNVVQMRRQIPLVADRMLPVSPLPDPRVLKQYPLTDANRIAKDLLRLLPETEVVQNS
jgi:hypothetical protein